MWISGFWFHNSPLYYSVWWEYWYGIKSCIRSEYWYLAVRACMPDLRIKNEETCSDLSTRLVSYIIRYIPDFFQYHHVGRRIDPCTNKRKTRVDPSNRSVEIWHETRPLSLTHTLIYKSATSPQRNSLILCRTTTISGIYSGKANFFEALKLHLWAVWMTFFP